MDASPDELPDNLEELEELADEWEEDENGSLETLSGFGSRKSSSLNFARKQRSSGSFTRLRSRSSRTRKARCS